jgi:hypothetical protein
MMNVKNVVKMKLIENIDWGGGGGDPFPIFENIYRRLDGIILDL